MDVGTILSAAQTLFAALQCSQLRELCFVLGYESELQNLKRTATTVKAVFQDAEAKHELSHEAQCYIEELKDALYDADDLIDEFVTLAERKQRKLAEGRKVSEKVRHFFSRFKDLGAARSLSRGVKEVRKRLDAIASDHNQFGFKLDSQPIRLRREETCSYVYAQDIIGRDDDLEKIKTMLLDSSVQRDVSSLTIVGIGGLGKTTLAQLVYNDERVRNYFDLRFWTCVSDDDLKHLDVKAILGKILESTTGQKNDGCSMEWLQSQFRQLIVGKKYLLVLDDVWNEDRDQWVKLEKFLRGGLMGCWVVVTTRSKETAKIVGDRHTYELQGLSDEDSWHLFERTAFEEGQGQVDSSEFVEIGQNIVQKCANVPLAIRVVGSLLYGQCKDKWQSFKDTGLAEISKGKNGISPILKLSYHHLEFSLKSCFAYCALFPKDYEINKELLISLWMAQGYVVPLAESQDVEDAAEEYFSILLRRCFFQDVVKDQYGEIYSCKMHDLMHDIAQEVARKEACVVNFITSELDRKTRHIFLAQNSKYTKASFTKSKIRTILQFNRGTELPMAVLFGNWMCLRTLGLKFSCAKRLPDTIGKLLHLRYLDLSNNDDLELLPKSITKLYNLQTLKVGSCYRLKALPDDLSKLIKLRLLDTEHCNELTHMPLGMDKLSCLHRLTMFVAGEKNSSSNVVDQLEDLNALANLKGSLRIQIRIPKDAAYVRSSASAGGYLMSKKHLNIIEIYLKTEKWEKREDYEEALLEDLQPHPNLRELKVVSYGGKKMPSWMKDDHSGSFFPNLVRISLEDCDGLQHLPSLGKLRHLKYLSLLALNLEYMENTRSSSNSRDSDPGICESSAAIAMEADLSFFPSLEELRLTELRLLKGWWRVDDDEQHQLLLENSTSSRRQAHLLPSFPRLSQLWIEGCPELTCIPLCPSMDTLSLTDYNEGLVLMKMVRDQTGSPSCSSNSSSLPLSQLDSGNSKLRRVFTDNVRGLKSVLPMEAFQCLTHLTIGGDREVESLEEVGEVFQICSSTLHSLIIMSCDNLSLSKAEKEAKDEDMPWRSVHQNLRSLILNGIHNLVNLPKGMQYLTSLQSLSIVGCRKLESLPEWMLKLVSLTRLEVKVCSKILKLRCHNPTGEDWPHIQHIPHVLISEGFV